jgi:hypothetical protein
MLTKLCLAVSGALTPVLSEITKGKASYITSIYIYELLLSDAALASLMVESRATGAAVKEALQRVSVTDAASVGGSSATSATRDPTFREWIMTRYGHYCVLCGLGSPHTDHKEEVQHLLSLRKKGVQLYGAAEFEAAHIVGHEHQAELDLLIEFGLQNTNAANNGIPLCSVCHKHLDKHKTWSAVSITINKKQRWRIVVTEYLTQHPNIFIKRFWQSVHGTFLLVPTESLPPAFHINPLVWKFKYAEFEAEEATRKPLAEQCPDCGVAFNKRNSVGSHRGKKVCIAAAKRMQTMAAYYKALLGEEKTADGEIILAKAPKKGVLVIKERWSC